MACNVQLGKIVLNYKTTNVRSIWARIQNFGLGKGIFRSKNSPSLQRASLYPLQKEVWEPVLRTAPTAMMTARIGTQSTVQPSQPTPGPS